MLECRMAANINRLGHTALLACQYSEGMEGQKEASWSWIGKGIPKVLWLKLVSPLHIFLAVYRLFTIIREYDIQVVVTTTLGTNIAATVATRLSGSKHIIAFHTYPNKELLQSFRGRVWKSFVRRADGYYCISSYVRLEAIRLLEIQPRLCRIVHNSIDMSIHGGLQKERGSLKSLIGIPTSSKMIVCIGRIEHRKGQDLAVRVAAPLLDQFDAFLVFAGGIERDKKKVLHEGELNFDKVIEGIASELGIQRRIRILGFTQDISAIIADADVLLQLSRHEGFGLVLLEAIAAGTPVVASNVGGIPEVLAGTPYVPIDLEEIDDLRKQIAKYLSISPDCRRILTDKAKQVLPAYNDNTRALEILSFCQQFIG